jgi:hypothetical protein
MRSRERPSKASATRAVESGGSKTTRVAQFCATVSTFRTRDAMPHERVCPATFEPQTQMSRNRAHRNRRTDINVMFAANERQFGREAGRYVHARFLRLGACSGAGSSIFVSIFTIHVEIAWRTQARRHEGHHRGQGHLCRPIPSIADAGPLLVFTLSGFDHVSKRAPSTTRISQPDSITLACEQRAA